MTSGPERIQQLFLGKSSLHSMLREEFARYERRVKQIEKAWREGRKREARKLMEKRWHQRRELVCLVVTLLESGMEGETRAEQVHRGLATLIGGDASQWPQERKETS